MPVPSPLQLTSLAFAAAITLALPGTSHSQDDAAPAVAHDFTDADLVVGDVPAVTVEHLRARRARRGPSLIRPRTNFLPELYGSVERL